MHRVRVTTVSSVGRCWCRSSWRKCLCERGEKKTQHVRFWTFCTCSYTKIKLRAGMLSWSTVPSRAQRTQYFWLMMGQESARMTEDREDKLHFGRIRDAAVCFSSSDVTIKCGMLTLICSHSYVSQAYIPYRHFYNMRRSCSQYAFYDLTTFSVIGITRRLPSQWPQFQTCFRPSMVSQDKEGILRLFLVRTGWFFWQKHSCVTTENIKFNITWFWRYINFAVFFFFSCRQEISKCGCESSRPSC